jgi:hypothetical protein
MTQHSEVVREPFTVQAKALVANPWVTHEERIRRLVATARLRGTSACSISSPGRGTSLKHLRGPCGKLIGVDRDPGGTRPFQDETGQVYLHALRDRDWTQVQGPALTVSYSKQST